MSRGEILIVAGVVFLPTALAVALWIWAAFGQTNDQGASGLILGSISAAVAIAIGLLTSGILIYRRR